MLTARVVSIELSEAAAQEPASGAFPY